MAININWRRVGMIGMVVTAIGFIPVIYLYLFPPHDLYCVVERNGKLMKAWDQDCKTADVVGPVLTKASE